MDLGIHQMDPEDLKGRGWERRTKSGRLASQIGREELEQYFHTPVDVAAQQMGVGLTKLKAICRTYDILRWPYRRVRRLQFLAQRIISGHGGAQDHADIKFLLYELDLPATSPLWRNLEIDFNRLLYELKKHEDNPGLLAGHAEVKPYKPTDEEEAADGLNFLAKIAAGESSDSQQEEPEANNRQGGLSDYMARHNIKLTSPSSYVPEVHINAHTGVAAGHYGAAPAFSHSVGQKRSPSGAPLGPFSRSPPRAAQGGPPRAPDAASLAMLQELFLHRGDSQQPAVNGLPAQGVAATAEQQVEGVQGFRRAPPAVAVTAIGAPGPQGAPEVGNTHWFEEHLKAEVAGLASAAAGEQPGSARVQSRAPSEGPQPQGPPGDPSQGPLDIDPAGGRRLMELLSYPLDASTVRLHQLPLEYQAYLAPMFVAWLKDLLLPNMD